MGQIYGTYHRLPMPITVRPTVPKLSTVKVIRLRKKFKITFFVEFF